MKARTERSEIRNNIANKTRESVCILQLSSFDENWGEKGGKYWERVKKWFRITIYWSRWLSQTFQTPSPSITPQFLELPQLEMIPTLPEKYKCKEFAEKKEMKRSGQVMPFKSLFFCDFFFVTNKVRLHDRSWVQEKQISRWIYEMHDLYRKSWCRRSWHLMGLNFCKANFCFISSAVVSVWVHYLKSPPKKEGKKY